MNCISCCDRGCAACPPGRAEEAVYWCIDRLVDALVFVAAVKRIARRWR